MDQVVIDYLMAGDPAIRWQTMRDLLNAPEAEWERERNRLPNEGWGERFLSIQRADGSWPNERWTANVWTLTLLVEIGMPPIPGRFERPFEQMVGRVMPEGREVVESALLSDMDLCHLSFWLRIGARFFPEDPRLKPLAETIMRAQFGDGGWNCRIRTVPKTRHSSFHTTLNVLEGLREATDAGIVRAEVFASSESRAIEFMLQHRLYRSDKTGEVISVRFTELSYPNYWHYTVLRGLDYIQKTALISDQRLEDPLNLLSSQRKTNGRWPVQKRIPGVILFDMEKMGQDSRWNTLRACRVLRNAGRI